MSIEVTAYILGDRIFYTNFEIGLKRFHKTLLFTIEMFHIER